MSAEPVISIRDVTFAYDGDPVLREVNLDVEAGEFASFVGPNGGGKTTLVKLILGLLTPGTGRVRLFGKPPSETRHQIGYLPQRVEHDRQFPVSVGDVVLMGRLGRRNAFGRYSRTDRRMAEAALEEVGLGRLRRRSFGALSGGERQRVLVARAVAAEPRLLLLDEPSTSLDPGAQEDLYALLARLNQRMTIIVVSHDVVFVNKHVRSVICVVGRVMQHAAGALDADLIRELYGPSEVQLVHHDHTHSG